MHSLGDFCDALAWRQKFHGNTFELTQYWTLDIKCIGSQGQLISKEIAGKVWMEKETEYISQGINEKKMSAILNRNKLQLIIVAHMLYTIKCKQLQSKCTLLKF